MLAEATSRAADARDEHRADMVATEVRGLANQAQRATEAIEADIRDIQESDARGGERDSDDRRHDWREVAEISSNIAVAMDQRSAGPQDIGRDVQQTAQAAHSVSINIIGIGQASETHVAACEVFDSTTVFSHQSEALGGEVSRFVANFRAA